MEEKSMPLNNWICIDRTAEDAKLFRPIEFLK